MCLNGSDGQAKNEGDGCEHYSESDGMMTFKRRYSGVKLCRELEMRRNSVVQIGLHHKAFAKMCIQLKLV